MGSAPGWRNQLPRVKPHSAPNIAPAMACRVDAASSSSGCSGSSDASAVVAVRPRALPIGACVLARSLPCRDAVACAAARFASCPRCHHNQAHAPVCACEASHVHMHVHVHMHIHMHVGMLDVAHVCVVWTSWVAVPAIPVRVSRAWNAQVSQCICHVGLSRNWGGITNGLSRQ